jgi:hypothetical protein
MTRHFFKDGLAFDYPDDWSLEEERDDCGWTATVQSPGSAFLVVRLDKLMNSVEDTLKTALEALKADYPDLEAEPAIESFAGEMAKGHDVDFFSLDMPVHCWTRAFYGLAGTMLVMGQCSDADAEEYDGPLRGIGRTMRLEEEDVVPDFDEEPTS